MEWLKKLPWLPRPDIKVYATVFSWNMLLPYFATLILVILVFCIPTVQQFTGLLPWEVALVGGVHFFFSYLPPMLFRRINPAKFIFLELFADRFTTSGMALFAAPDATFLWLFFSFLCFMEVISVAPSIYSGLLILVSPVAAWVTFTAFGLRPFLWHDLWVILTVATLTLLIWLFVAQATAQYRQTQREVENAKAQAELEKSRSDLSRDIHDAIAAIFTRILSIQKDENSETAKLTREGLSQLRDIVTALQAENTSLGFLSSWLNHYAQHYFEKTGVNVQFIAQYSSAEITIEPIRIIHIMRIYQELCQNTLKHAAASEVLTSFEESQNKITLLFSDNGSGIIHEKTESFGLKNIADRAQELGGTLEQRQRPEGGFETRLSFAL